MGAEDCLRLAWEADREGRRKFRDSLLTLAVVESGPSDTWADRCRARLVLERPGHYLAGFATVRLALADPRVIDARARLRVKYPDGKIAGLLLIARSSRGRFTGRTEAIEAILEDLVGPPAEAENVRRDAPERVRGPLTARVRAIHTVPSGLALAPVSGWDGPPEPPDESGPDLDRFYQSVLFAIAVLLRTSTSGAGGTGRVNSRRWRFSRVSAPASRRSRASIAASRT